MNRGQVLIGRFLDSVLVVAGAVPVRDRFHDLLRDLGGVVGGVWPETLGLETQALGLWAG